MKTIPKVSVVLVSYNGEKYINQQIQSILKQTYQDIELLVCDDASTDNTQQIVRSLTKKDKRIILYANKKNVGTGKNVELGLQKSRGEYIAISDQDDYWINNKLKQQVEFLEKNKEISLVYHDSIICDQDLKRLYPSFRNLQKGKLTNIHNVQVENDSLLALLRENHISGHTIMIRRNLLKNIIPIPRNIFPDWWVALVAATFSKIGFIEKPLSKYRQHSNNLYSGAWIRGYRYYLRNIFNKNFASSYVLEKKHFIQTLNQLSVRIELRHSEKQLVQEKIIIFRELIKLIESSNPITFLQSCIRAFQQILLSKHRYHLTFLIYFIIYKVNLFKLKKGTLHKTRLNIDT